MIMYKTRKWKNRKEYENAVLESAIATALIFHRDQTDIGEDAYILHLLRIMMQMKTFEEKIVALLKDVFEDSACTMGETRVSTEYTKEIEDALIAIKRENDEDYFDYINRVKENSMARNVKIAELTDNLMQKGEDVIYRERYYKALKMLCGEDNLPTDRILITSFYGMEIYIDRLWPEVRCLEVNYQDECVFKFSLVTEVYPRIGEYQYTERVFMDWYKENKTQIIKMIAEDKYYELPDWEKLKN